MAKTKEQERMEAAMGVGILLADCPGVLAGVQKMLETPWFLPLGKGERKRAKNAVSRLVKAVGKPGKGERQAEAPLFDMRRPKAARTVSAAPQAALSSTGTPSPQPSFTTTATTRGQGCPSGIHILNGGDCDCPPSPARVA